ncbi:hypothetical protein [Dyella sp. C9]|uniref:hypothetical protein n=1 Tax=Dyella sp. C9 TaxID=2202154 RepID=UPI001300414A|nr:hypothetical protein [Dyella sp. C9]
MRSVFSNVLFMLVIVGWAGSAASNETYCASGQVSLIKLRVTIQPQQRQDFIRFLMSGKEASILGAGYVGGAESSDSLSIGFLEILDQTGMSTVTIRVDNENSSPVFDFSFSSCNNHRALEPYRDAARRKVGQFGVVSVVEVTSK